MSIISDHSGRAASATPPPCPPWCQIRTEHEVPLWPDAGGVVRREHTLVLVDEPEVGYVAVVRAEDFLHPYGPAVSGPVAVLVEDVPVRLRGDQLRRLTHFLDVAAVVAAGLQAEDVGPPAQSPGAAGAPGTAETLTVLAEAQRLIAEHLRGPGAAEVVARIDVERERLGGGR